MPRAGGARGKDCMSDLYDDDVVLWAERQADALRRRASNEVDWDNVADEIEGVARNEVSTVLSSIENILQHRICIEGWPDQLAAHKWHAERHTFNRKLKNSYTKSMTRDGAGPVTDKAVCEIYTDAVEHCLSHMDTAPTRPLPPECLWTLAELLAEAKALPPE